MRNILTCPERELVRDNSLVVGMFRVKINVDKTRSSVLDSPARLVLFIKSEEIRKKITLHHRDMFLHCVHV